MLNTNEWVVDGNDVWFLATDSNIIFKGNREETNFEMFCNIGNIVQDTNCAFSMCKKWGDYLYCLPDRSNKIVRVNIKNKDVEYIEISGVDNYELGIFDAFKKETEIYMYSFRNEAVIRFSINDFSAVSVYCGGSDVFDDPVGSCMINEKLWFPINTKSSVGYFDINSEEFIFFTIENVNCVISYVFAIDEKIILADMEGKRIFIGKVETDCIFIEREFLVSPDPSKEIISELPPVDKMLCINEYVYVFFRIYPKILVFNYLDGTVCSSIVSRYLQNDNNVVVNKWDKILLHYMYCDCNNNIAIRLYHMKLIIIFNDILNIDYVVDYSTSLYRTLKLYRFVKEDEFFDIKSFLEALIMKGRD